MMRTHVLLPKRLVEAIDDLVGQRRRSRFLAEAAQEKLERRRQLEALQAVAQSHAEVEVPEWETPELAAEWVAQLRADGDQRLETARTE